MRPNGNERDRREAVQHLRAEFLECMLSKPTPENRRKLRAVCDKLKKWRKK